MVAQFLGAFVGAAIVYGIYHEALLEFDPEKTVALTGGIWATYPANHLSIGGGLLDQVGANELKSVSKIRRVF